MIRKGKRSTSEEHAAASAITVDLIYPGVRKDKAFQARSRRPTLRWLLFAVAAGAIAATLLYTNYTGSGAVEAVENERTVFWISVAGAIVGLSLPWFTSWVPWRIALGVIIGTAIFGFCGALLIYEQPALARFGHALALGTGNAIVFGLSAWLLAVAIAGLITIPAPRNVKVISEPESMDELS